MLILGIDDAGRGPIIGPMVLAGALIDFNEEKHLREIGVKDSKMLTAKKREFLAEKIKKIAVDFEIIKISPAEIDARGDIGINLNNLEAIKMAEIVNKIIARVKEKHDSTDKIKIVIDCPSNNIKKWQEYFEKYLENKEILEVHAEWKADVNHAAVSSASILAKTTRDDEIEKIKKHVGVDMGSGYPADPVTIKFLKNYAKKYEKDGIFRKTWQTWKDLKGKKEQKELGAY